MASHAVDLAVASLELCRQRPVGERGEGDEAAPREFGSCPVHGYQLNAFGECPTCDEP